MAIRDFKIEPGGEKAKGDPKFDPQDLERPTADQIFDQVARNGRRELKRPALGLALSGIVGGLTMGLTGLSVSTVGAMVGVENPGYHLIAMLFYPVGFLAVILGRGQLFTENTLYPVALILAERRHVLATARLWGLVYPCNVIGALLFAVLAARTEALRPDALQLLTKLGTEAAAPTMLHVFWSGVVGGWLIAMVAWMVSGSHSITGSVMVIWVLTFIVGIGHFAHCIATSGEILTAVLAHAVSWAGYGRWLLAASLGNISGGVILVTLLEYGQTKLE